MHNYFYEPELDEIPSVAFNVAEYRAECAKKAASSSKDFETRWKKFWRSLEKFDSIEEARAVLRLGQDPSANIVEEIPGTAYYVKACITPGCGRVFESTIRGLYCNCGSKGAEGSSCRVKLKRMKEAAREYIANRELYNGIIWFYLILGVLFYWIFVGFKSYKFVPADKDV